MRKKRVVRRARRPRGEPVALVVILGVVLVALLGGLTWARGVVLPFLVRTQVVESGAIERVFEADAAVMRRETVYVAAISGRVRFLVGEGERVRTGMTVVEISNPATRKAAEERLAEVEARIAEFDRENRSRYESLRRQVASLDSSISTAARALQGAYSLQDRARMAQAEADLAALIEKRGAALHEIESLDGKRRDIETQRDGVRTLLERAANVLESQTPGIVSYVFDGYEKEFASTRTRDVTARTVFLAQPKPKAVSDQQDVKAGEPLFRVVQADQGYLAVAFPSNRITELGGAAVRVRVPELGGKTLNTRVVRVDTGPPGGHALVVLELEGLPQELLTLRKSRVSVVTRSTQGVVVPGSAVTTRAGVAGVFIVYKTMAQWKPVQVKAEDGGRAVVDGILPGSEVVVNPWLVREGRQVK
ncbi:MAG: hypothetical protein HPY55_13525 [Firmicutes bacterium]|nr:hypothetical protein [Bacillota bacterium]